MYWYIFYRIYRTKTGYFWDHRARGARTKHRAQISTEHRAQSTEEMYNDERVTDLCSLNHKATEVIVILAECHSITWYVQRTVGSWNAFTGHTQNVLNNLKTLLEMSSNRSASLGNRYFWSEIQLSSITGTVYCILYTVVISNK